MSSIHITIQQFCAFHQCDAVVVEDFVEHGIIEIQHENEVPIIPSPQLSRLEQALRLHLDLGVNAAGIDIILNLLDRLEGERLTAIKDLE